MEILTWTFNFPILPFVYLVNLHSLSITISMVTGPRVEFHFNGQSLLNILFGIILGELFIAWILLWWTICSPFFLRNINWKSWCRHTFINSQLYLCRLFSGIPSTFIAVNEKFYSHKFSLGHSFQASGLKKDIEKANISRVIILEVDSTILKLEIVFPGIFSRNICS